MNIEKWLFISEMVKEKNKELQKLISAISYNNISIGNRLRRLHDIIASRFLPDDLIESKRKNWLDNISEVDLLHVYSYLNWLIGCFNYYATFSVHIFNSAGQIPIDYKFERSRQNDMQYLTDNEVFDSVLDNIKKKRNSRYVGMNKYFSKNKHKRTIQFLDEEKPTPSQMPMIDLYNINKRRNIISELIVEARDRYDRINKVVEHDSFDVAMKEFYLRNSKHCFASLGEIPRFDIDFSTGVVDYQELDANKSPSLIRKRIDSLEANNGDQCLVKKIIGDTKPADVSSQSEVEDEVEDYDPCQLSIFVGIDEFGNPITKDKEGNLYLVDGTLCDEDKFYYDPND